MRKQITARINRTVSMSSGYDGLLAGLGIVSGASDDRVGHVTTL